VTPPGTDQLVAAAVELVPAFLFAVVASIVGSARRIVFPDVPVLRRLPHPLWLVSLHYLVIAMLVLLPPELARARPPGVRAASAVADFALILFLPGLRQIVTLVTTPGWRPTRAWLVRDYGPALALCGLGALVHAVPPSPAISRWLPVYQTSIGLYLIVLGGAMLYRIRHVAEPGSWRPGGIAGPHVRDTVIVAGGLALTAVLIAVILTERGKVFVPVLHAGIGLLCVGPMVAMMIGMVVRQLLFALAMVTAAAGIYFGAGALHATAGPALGPVVDVGAIVVLLAVFLAGRDAVRRAIDRFVFRRSRRRAEELQAFLHTLSPELGVLECSRRAIHELARVMQLRGVAILLDDGRALATGDLALDRLREVWPRGAAAAALPSRLSAPEFGTLPLPLRGALVEADVLGAIAVASPRRHWGHLVATTGIRGVIVADEDTPVLLAFADQLALVLDAAELLARAVAVERSLAHAEKLAAIGETAARIAHDVRNPITAARSLAQQLARDPGSAANAEPAQLIVAELERVERRLRDLLRFARREEFSFTTVDLATLARDVLESFGPRLEAAGIALDLDLADGTAADADEDKMRQVLGNLVENAIDALADAPNGRRLTLAVKAIDASATIRVADNGPGVAPDALSHLFEPFFSQKANGTGLGLAIAKRTVDAHGGRIVATTGPGTGLTVRVDLPLRQGARRARA